jgi:hypothetical protein
MSLDYNKDETVLFEFRVADGKAPSMAAFQKNFGLGDHEVDHGYTFIPMGKDTFLTVITRDAADRVQAEKHPDVVGVFSNGRVDAFKKGADQPKNGGFGTFGPPKM